MVEQSWEEKLKGDCLKERRDGVRRSEAPFIDPN